MKSVIRELWQDKINPSVEVNTITPEIKELYAKIEIVEEKITANFTKSKSKRLRITQSYIVNAQAYCKKQHLHTECVLE